MSKSVPASAIWVLGATQIVGYGTLLYAFSVLAPAIGATFQWPQEWVFAGLSLSLLAGGLAAPVTGSLIDRLGAGPTMTAGSALVCLCLVAMALAPSGPLFALALIAVGLVSGAVQYASAFAALVQIGGRRAQVSITHLTLIAGFASTLFWPLTSLLAQAMDWRSIYLIFAVLNLACAPAHWWIGTLREQGAGDPQSVPVAHRDDDTRRVPRVTLLLLLAGFALEGFVLSAVLNHIVPIVAALGMGSVGIFVTTLFGPAQVLSRLVNMIFGKGLAQTSLAIVAAALPGLGIVLLLMTAPAALGGMAFALLFGLGSGLTSIVAGSLPLELFGREGYGARLGWLSSARQIAAAVAPFAFAVGTGVLGTQVALAGLAGLGAAAVVIFVAIALRRRNSGEAIAAAS